VAAKVAAKFTMAFPFTFHGVNGVSHLIWDTGNGLVNNKQIIRRGWGVVAVSVSSAGYLAMML
jgi:succinate dehydrogenase (ubiquinone) cytochrome b560 subunit